MKIKLLRSSLRNHPEIPNKTKNQNSEQKEIRIHNERSQQQKSNDNSENPLVNCVFIFAYDNNCLYWIENKLFLLFLLFIYKVWMHLKVFVKLKKTLKTLSSGQKNPKKTPKKSKKPKKPKKTQKTPLGWL